VIHSDIFSIARSPTKDAIKLNPSIFLTKYMSIFHITAAELPPIIQGGMGVGVSGWRLARAVSQAGQLGVVSGTMLDVVIARTLQLGDEGGHIRRALKKFPNQDMADRMLVRYFREGGIESDASFRSTPMMTFPPARPAMELSVLASFVSIWLAKEGHDGQAGLNLLEKSQLPTMSALYGAMLAGVDVVLMGAGIPRQIPGILDRLATGNVAELRIDVTGADKTFAIEFDPALFCHSQPQQLKRPLFLAVVSSPVLAENLRRKSSGKVDGFIVEAATAGGHNAPPRGAMQLTENGEPIYGPRDTIEISKFREIGLPFWLAGGYGSGGKLRDAQAEGAMGIQVGTVFALSDESGFDPKLKAELIDAIRRNDLAVFTNPVASPTGFPFKVAQLPETLSEPKVYEHRERVCDLGVLRETYMKEDGSVGFRCSAEPVDIYAAKGGDVSRTVGSSCLCNSLGASIGLGQRRSGGFVEPPLITLGDDLDSIRGMLSNERTGYSAQQVIEKLLE
jgi:nitronate monooxygenase